MILLQIPANNEVLQVLHNETPLVSRARLSGVGMHMGPRPECPGPLKPSAFTKYNECHLIEMARHTIRTPAFNLRF